MSSYKSGIESLRSEAIEEAKLSGNKYLVSQVYSECCVNAVGKSRFRGLLGHLHCYSDCSKYDC